MRRDARLSALFLMLVALVVIGLGPRWFVRFQDRQLDQFVAAQITINGTSWDWNQLKARATGEMEKKTADPDWAQTVYRLSALGAPREIKQSNGQMAISLDSQSALKLVGYRNLTFHCEKGDIQTWIEFTWTRKGWKYSNFRIDRYQASPSVTPSIADAKKPSREELESDVTKLLTESNVSLRRGIKQVRELIAIYQEEGRTDDVVRLLRRSLAVDSSDLNSQVTLAETLEAQGNHDEAREVAENAYKYAESSLLLHRLGVILPDIAATKTSEWSWNASGAPSNGPRIVLAPIGEPPSLIHHELGAAVSAFLHVPVTLVDLGLSLGEPDRRASDRWMDQIYQQATATLTSNQFALLNVPGAVAAGTNISTRQKQQVIEAIIKMQGDKSNAAVERFRDKLKSLENEVQYNGFRLANELKAAYASKYGELVCGIAAGDIYKGEANYLFSTGVGNYSCVSFVRYSGKFWDESENRQRMLERALRTAVWSAFTAAKLPACKSAYCVRTYVHSLGEQDRNTKELCAPCAALWQKYLDSFMSELPFTALREAVMRGQADVVKELLQAGARYDVTNEYGFTPLCLATNLNIVQLLLDSGANPNDVTTNGWTPLTLAAHYNNTDIAVELLKRNADANRITSERRSALRLASYWTNTVIMQALLDHGADINETNRGMTVLSTAAWYNNTSVVQFLVDRGADLDRPEYDGETPLISAARKGSTEAGRVLIKSGANPYATNSNGLTAWHIAKLNGLGGFAEMMESLVPGLPATNLPMVRSYFAYYDPDATNVTVGGLFNEWNDRACPMSRAPDGYWYAEINLFDASYPYKFIVDGQWVLDPENSLIDDNNGDIRSKMYATNYLAPRPIRQAPLPDSRRGYANFAYSNDTARAVFVAGEFNSWSATSLPMTRTNVWSWQATARIRPGTYGYKFVADKYWILDPNNQAIRVVNGITNSLLVVPGVLTP